MADILDTHLLILMGTGEKIIFGYTFNYRELLVPRSKTTGQFINNLFNPLLVTSKVGFNAAKERNRCGGST